MRRAARLGVPRLLSALHQPAAAAGLQLGGSWAFPAAACACLALQQPAVWSHEAARGSRLQGTNFGSWRGLGTAVKEDDGPLKKFRQVGGHGDWLQMSSTGGSSACAAAAFRRLVARLPAALTLGRSVGIAHRMLTTDPPPGVLCHPIISGSPAPIAACPQQLPYCHCCGCCASGCSTCAAPLCMQHLLLSHTCEDAP